jgi:hypothetical protein
MSKTNRGGCATHPLAGMLGAGDGYGECLGGLTIASENARYLLAVGVGLNIYAALCLHFGHAAIGSLPHETCTCEMVTSCPDRCRMHVIRTERLRASLQGSLEKLALLRPTSCGVPMTKYTAYITVVRLHNHCCRTITDCDVSRFLDSCNPYMLLK